MATTHRGTMVLLGILLLLIGTATAEGGGSHAGDDRKEIRTLKARIHRDESIMLAEREENAGDERIIQAQREEIAGLQRALAGKQGGSRPDDTGVSEFKQALRAAFLSPQGPQGRTDRKESTEGASETNDPAALLSESAGDAQKELLQMTQKANAGTATISQLKAMVTKCDALEKRDELKEAVEEEPLSVLKTQCRVFEKALQLRRESNQLQKNASAPVEPKTSAAAENADQQQEADAAKKEGVMAKKADNPAAGNKTTGNAHNAIKTEDTENIETKATPAPTAPTLAPTAQTPAPTECLPNFVSEGYASQLADLTEIENMKFTFVAGEQTLFAV